VPFDIIPFFRAQKSVIGSFVYTREEVESCLELARRGKIVPLVYRVFPLEDAAEAMATMERREHFGKIVLDCSVDRATAADTRKEMADEAARS
jgi:D-arabinose 1-dehydrogenase-like Zn-dependent alcohol dehydrogenase